LAVIYNPEQNQNK